MTWDPGTGQGEALELMLEFTRLQGEAMTLLLGANFAKNRGDLEEAATQFERLIEVHEQQIQLAKQAAKGEDGPDFELPGIAQSLSTVLFTLADVRDAQSLLDDARVLRERAMGIVLEYLDAEGSAEAQRTLASTLLAEGRHNEALVALARATDFAESEGDTLKRAQLLNQRANVLHWLGDHERALECIEGARELIGPVPDTPVSDFGPAAALLKALTGGAEHDDVAQSVALITMATDLEFNYGLILRSLGRYGEARAVLERLLPRYAQLGYAAALRYQLSSILMEEGLHEEGLAVALAIEPEFRATGLMRPKLGALLRIQATALRNLGRLDEAKDKIEEALADIVEFADPDVRWRIEAEHARVLEGLGIQEEALAAFEAATLTIDRLRTGSLGYRLDSLFLVDKVPVFDDAIESAVKAGHATAALAMIERIKARTLATVLRTPDDKTGTSESSKEVASLTRRLDRIEYQGYKDGWSPELDKVFVDTSRRRRDAIERARYSDPRWRTLSEPAALDFEALQASLAERDQSVLVLRHTGDSVTAILLDSEGPLLDIRPLDASTRDTLNAYAKNLEAAPEQLNRGAFDPSAHFGLDLADILPQSVIERALNHSSLIVIPHRALHLLPWSGLAVGGARVFERLPVGVLPNLTSLIALDFDPSTAPTVALFGDPDYGWYPLLEPLPAAADELAQIHALYGTDRTIGEPRTGAAASESEFWDIVRSAPESGGILHLACHATVEPSDPTQSGLLLSDSKVDAAELAQNRLGFDEVVLSACSTGWTPQAVGGVELSGDDAVGLPGALLEAGTRSVLVSIPPADDAAAQALCVAYHRERSAGTPPLFSLQAAQIALYAAGQYEPSAWIGFTGYGCR